MSKKALIAMSGGVDSSVAALLMKNAGYDCIGAMMRLWGGANAQDEKDAAAVAKRLDIPFYTFDLQSEFQNRVINKFIQTYESGATPNPCLDCNRYLKFGALYEKARELGCEYIATGHYVICAQDKKSGRYLIKKPPTLPKTRVMCCIPCRRRSCLTAFFRSAHAQKARSERSRRKTAL